MPNTPERGVWLLRPNGDLVQLPADPADEYYLEPRTLGEKEPAGPTEFVNSADAYTRFILRDGPKTVAVYYAHREASAAEEARLLNAAYRSYGRD